MPQWSNWTRQQPSKLYDASSNLAWGATLRKLMFKAKPKLKEETRQYELCRRLEEYVEYAEQTKRFADVGFYLELLEYIEE